jgi:hypothetical protein
MFGEGADHRLLTTVEFVIDNMSPTELRALIH